MTAKLTPQTRLLAVLGLVLVVAFAGMTIVRGGLLGSSASEPAAEVPAPSATAATPVPATTRPAPRAAVPKHVAILPGVPGKVAGALQRSTVVVAALVGGGSADHARVVEARAGAHSVVGAAFVTIDVRKEAQARALAGFAGKESDATVLVITRPGKIANSFDSYVDRAIVAQAAVNAGARPKPVAKQKAAGKARGGAVAGAKTQAGRPGRH